LPFLLPLLLWHERRWRTHWPFAAVFFVLAPLLWLYRWNVLSGWGNHTGSNGAWLHRVLIDTLGIPGFIANGDWLYLAPIFAALILVWLWRSRECGGQKSLGLLLVAGVAGMSLSIWKSMLFNSAPLFDTLLRLTLPENWNPVLLVAIFFLLWAQFIARLDRAQIFALGWVWVTFIPLAMQPPTSSHVHYPVAPGWSLFLACALWALPESLKHLMHWLKPVPSASNQHFQSPIGK
jgi:hypothetical protein